jgi:hypothetical protein
MAANDFSPFKDTGLSDAKINDRYVWKNVKGVDSKLEARIFVDEATDKIVAPVTNTIFDLLDDDISLYGSRLESIGSERVVNIGTRNTVNVCTASVCIGGVDGADNAGFLVNSNNTISIGHGNQIGDPGMPSDSNVMIGDDIALDWGVDNVIIGHFPWGAGNEAPGLTNCVQISGRPVGASFPVDGSIILGGGIHPHSGLAKFQLLGDGLIGLTNFAHAAAYNPVDANQATVSNGWLRMKYQGQNIKIPIQTDNDAAIP